MTEETSVAEEIVTDEIMEAALNGAAEWLGCPVDAWAPRDLGFDLEMTIYCAVRAAIKAFDPVLWDEFGGR
jgi:hypothetical protein